MPPGEAAEVGVEPGFGVVEGLAVGADEVELAVVGEAGVEVDVVAGAGAGQRGRELLGLDRRLPLRNPRPGCRGPAFGSDSG